MRILVGLTYYRPHVSGLTIYVERLARALASRGHDVTVLTSQYDSSLPRGEERDGVRIVRVPVALRISKGVIMPTIGWEATRQVAQHDVVHLHLPQLDATGIALRGRLMGRPVVLTYHSDLRLPPTFINRIANLVVDIANHSAALLANRIVAYTEDFATHSPFLSRYLDKVEVIPPPVEVSQADSGAADDIASQAKGGGPFIGMAARLATEKGVEHLLAALPHIIAEHPDAEVLFAGPYRNVLGEQDYARRLAPLLDQFDDHWTFLGVLDPDQMAAFYDLCDVTVLPSINNTETFGLVQIESMICGTPVVASNLPGVRQPITMTGMGEIVPVADSNALGQAILQVLRSPEQYRVDPEGIARRFSPDTVAAKYESLFGKLIDSDDVGSVE